MDGFVLQSRALLCNSLCSSPELQNTLCLSQPRTLDTRAPACPADCACRSPVNACQNSLASDSYVEFLFCFWNQNRMYDETELVPCHCMQSLHTMSPVSPLAASPNRHHHALSFSIRTTSCEKSRTFTFNSNHDV